jgi:tetratricopeptide (TPR) repeat protein
MTLALLLLLLFRSGSPAQDPASPGPAVNPVFARAVDLQRAGKTAEAITEYLRFLALYPENVEARSNLGAAFASQGRYLEAIGEYEEALARNPGNLQVRLNLGMAHYKAGALRAAAAEIEKVVAASPGDKRAVLLLADCHLRLGENARVIELLSPLEAADSDDLVVAYVLGTALVRDDQVSRGQRLVDKILRRGDTAEAHLMLGTAHQMAQDFASAREEFAKAVALNPALPAAHAYYGRALMATGDPEGAAVQFRKELEKNPNDFEANLFLGVLSKQGLKLDEAMSYFQKALLVRPGDLAVRYQIGSLDIQRGRLAEALETLEAVARDAPKFVEAHVSLATLYYRQKRREEGDRERAIVRELSDEVQARAPGASPELGPAYRGEIPMDGPKDAPVTPP